MSTCLSRVATSCLRMRRHIWYSASRCTAALHLDRKNPTTNAIERTFDWPGQSFVACINGMLPHEPVSVIMFVRCKKLPSVRLSLTGMTNPHPLPELTGLRGYRVESSVADFYAGARASWWWWCRRRDAPWCCPWWSPARGPSLRLNWQTFWKMEIKRFKFGQTNTACLRVCNKVNQILLLQCV